jgi:virginiamycin A acetyltransferase
MSMTINNETLNTKLIANPVGKLGPMSRIINSDLAPRFFIDKGACLNRSTTGQYFGLGCFSYVADTSIGRYCLLGSRISVGPFDHPTDWLSIHDFQYRNISAVFGETLLEHENITQDLNVKTVIGSDVWIGDNVTIRRGVTIGCGAVIGMSAVVVSDVPPFAIVLGNPGRIVRFRFDADIIEDLLEIEWWKHDLKALNGVDFPNIRNAIAMLRERF